MDAKAKFHNEVAESVFCAAARTGEGLYARAYECPAQVRLSVRHRDILFGNQPIGTVRVQGAKASLGLPVADGDFEQTAVEISFTEALRIGIKGLRIYDGTKRGADCVLHGPDGKVTLEGGVFAPPRRLCISPNCAAVYGLADGQRIWAKVESDNRSLTLGNILVCTAPCESPRLSLDPDESCAAGLTDGQMVQLFTTSP